MESSSVQAMLLNDAQQEIANLRADLYQTRRTAEERRQALEATGQAKSRSDAAAAEAAAALLKAQEQLAVLQNRDAALQALQADHERLQQEFEMAVRARKILQDELQTERRLRTGVEEAKAVLESDRSRLQKLRDELTAQLRVAQNKAQEAEDEQIRAEQECADARAELAALQAMQQFEEGRAGHIGGSSSSTAAAAAAQAPLLAQQLEHERSRAAALLSSLHAAKAELSQLAQQLHDANLRDGELVHAHGELAAMVSELDSARATIQRLETMANTSMSAPAETAAPGAANSRSSSADVKQHLASVSTNSSPRTASASGEADGAPQYSHQDCNGHAQYGRHGGGDKDALEKQKPSGLHSTLDSQQSLLLLENAAGLGVKELLQELEKRGEQVSKLRASRDKLLHEIDAQWDDLEKLGQENRGLSDELSRMRALAESWEAQAQDGLQHITKLKDLLEESALWSASDATTAAAVAAGSSAPGSAAGAAAPLPPVATAALASLQSLLLQEKACTAELELQLRALASELLRARHSHLDLGRSVLPLMAGVEHRLARMCVRARAVAAANPGVASHPAALEG